MRVLIVADDLTGAMDAAAPFADSGVPARVLLGPPTATAWPDGIGVLSLDTDSRERSPHAAALAVRHAFSAIDASGCLLFKKIDSTLRGHLAGELRSALAASGRRVAIVAPAAPAQGRTLCDGYLYLDGQRSGERSLVDRLHEELAGFDVRALTSPSMLDVPQRPTVYVVDAQSEAQLDDVAEFGLRQREDVLLAGSSGLSGALARAIAQPAPMHPLPRYASAWFLVGSYHARSAEQVRAATEEQCVSRAIVLAPDQPSPADALLEAPVGLVYVGGIGAAPRRDAAWISDRIAEIGTRLARFHEDSVLFLTGGATARAVLDRLGANAVDIVGSQRTGVVHGQVTLGERRLGVITKAGGFGAAGLVAQLASELVAAHHQRTSL